MQRTVFRTVVVGLAAFFALGATCAQTPTQPTPLADVVVPTNFPTPGPTLPWKSALTGVAQSVEEAVSFAREEIQAKPPFVVTEPESLVYVEATVGDARNLFDPNHETKLWDVPDDVRAVIFVAYGRFQWRSVPSSSMRGPTYTTLWVVVPLGQRGTHSATTNDRYDLTQLGQVHEVRLPLPRFPTPVPLSSPALTE